MLVGISGDHQKKEKKNPQKEEVEMRNCGDTSSRYTRKKEKEEEILGLPEATKRQKGQKSATERSKTLLEWLCECFRAHPPHRMVVFIIRNDLELQMDRRRRRRFCFCATAAASAVAACAVASLRCREQTLLSGKSYYL